MESGIRKQRAPRNRTLEVSPEESALLEARLVRLTEPAPLGLILSRTINQDIFEVLDLLPQSFADLAFLDPPYNLSKDYEATQFQERSASEYRDWIESWLPRFVKTLKPTASVYICSDWRSSSVVQRVAERHLIVRNRITWEREKGRAAATNWKNCSEDIWFCTKSDAYTFNLDAVRIRRRVIAPYRLPDGQPKDWDTSTSGNYRLTSPSNLWTDLTVPFWSMPENTDHPTQKPEKLLAKIILASSDKGDLVLDPFLGSGTTSVVAKKLGRAYVGIEQSREYCLWAEKRLRLAEVDQAIQGYEDGVFWERNSQLPSKSGRIDALQGNLLPVGEEAAKPR